MNNKGFQGFINSIITDKGPQKKQKKANNESKVIPQASQSEDLGDLALIQAIQDDTKAKKKSGNQQDLRPKNVGLGYEKQITEAEIQANTQIQKLKNQLKQENQIDSQDLNKKDKVNQLKNDDQLGKSGISKKQFKGIDNKDELLQQKKEKKRLKKEKQKLKKQQDKVKEDSQNKKEAKVVKDFENQQQQPPKRSYKITKEKEPENGRRRYKTKTRSKQKNMRRDKRPDEIKRAKLAEKGIII